MNNHVDRVNETQVFLEQSLPEKPEWVAILGSGLGTLANELEYPIRIPYSEVPHFPVSTVMGHSGNLIFGYWNKQPVIAMQGRFHVYEGYSMQEVTFPVRVFGQWGVKKLLISNAAGGMNPKHEIGEVMWITDHINLMGSNPLIGRNVDAWGPRFPDMSEVYRRDWIAAAHSLLLRQGHKSSTGIYMAVTGPTFETPAEYAAFRILGADAVGMSTVPEAIAAHHMGMSILGLSVISDLGIAGRIEKVNHKKVLEGVKLAEKVLQRVIPHLLQSLE